MNHQDKKLNNNVEVLRVAAMGLMIVYHCVLFSPGDELILKAFRFLGRVGWTGTDVFLCIAGFYCITIVKDRFQNVRGFLNYIVNRMLRIIPSYYIFLLLYLNVGVLLQRSVGNDFHLAEGFISSLLLFVCNFDMAYGVLSGVAIEGMFSLAIYVQLIILFGFITSLLKSTKKFVVIIVTLELLACILRIVYWDDNHWPIYFNTLTRMDSFLAGALLAVLYRSSVRDLLRRRRLLLLAISSSLLVITALFTEGLSLWNNLTTILAYPPLALFVFSLMNWALSRTEGELVRVLAKAGKYSFSIYMIKLPFIYVVSAIVLKFMGDSNPLLNAFVILVISVPGCYLLGFIWYHTVENLIKLVLKKYGTWAL